MDQYRAETGDAKATIDAERVSFDPADPDAGSRPFESCLVAPNDASS